MVDWIQEAPCYLCKFYLRIRHQFPCSHMGQYKTWCLNTKWLMNSFWMKWWVPMFCWNDLDRWSLRQIGLYHMFHMGKKYLRWFSVCLNYFISAFSWELVWATIIYSLAILKRDYPWKYRLLSHSWAPAYLFIFCLPVWSYTPSNSYKSSLLDSLPFAQKYSLVSSALTIFPPFVGC